MTGRYWLPFTMVMLFLAYFPVLSAKKTVDPDANVILTNLSTLTGISEYSDNLITLKTIDFQPVRDATLALDLWIFRTLGFNTIIWQNFLWWLASLFVLRSFFRRLSANPLADFYLTAFAVYPLFSGVLSWGMNRKHLLAFFFIIAATHLLLKKISTLSRRELIFIPVLYFLAVFSQPIVILWPLWVAIVFFQEKWPSGSKKLLGILSVIMVAAACLNYLYYQTSPTYLYFYPGKTSDLLNIPDKILAVGHYGFQIFFPYLLSFKYHLGHWSVFAGLILSVLFSWIIIKSPISRKDLIRWGWFGIFPLLTVLNDPHVLADSYLLMPVLAVVILLLQFKFSVEKKVTIVLTILCLFLSIRTYIESSNWTDRTKLADKSFETRPSCLSAVNAAKVGFDLYQRKNEALEYIVANDCFTVLQVNPFFYRSMVVMFSHYYFHSDELPPAMRLERLNKLSENNILAHLSLAGLLIKLEKLDEARTEIDRIVSRWERTQIPDDYHEITVRFVRPFCEREKLEGCLAVTEKLISKPNRPNL